MGTYLPVLWIWIGSDPHHFAGSGSVSIPKKMKKLIGILFPENITMMFKIVKIMTYFTLLIKKKHCQLTMLLLKGKKSMISNMCKTWGRIRIRIGIFLCRSGFGSRFGLTSTWKFRSWSASKQCRSTTPVPTWSVNKWYEYISSHGTGC